MRYEEQNYVARRRVSRTIKVGDGDNRWRESESGLRPMRDEREKQAYYANDRGNRRG